MVNPIYRLPLLGSVLSSMGKEMKHCKKCGQTKPVGDFTNARGKRGGLFPNCRSCVNARTKEYRDKNPYHTRNKRYNIDFEDLLESQGGRCLVCKTSDPSGVAGKGRDGWAVDHDHDCCPGKGSCGRCVRGILCHPCNVGLGFLNDSRERVQALLDYLASSTNALPIS